MDFKRVAIIGVDSISVSIAYGLKAQKEPPGIVGYSPDAVTADLAKTRGAFDQVERNPGLACQGADLVIISVPISDMRDTFSAIAPHLQPETLVTDTARLKAPPTRWAEEVLPQSVSFIGGHPILNPAVVGLAPVEDLDDADAGLLKNALYCFTPTAGVSSAAIDACAELAQTLGAYPYFIDVKEHDGLQAGVVGLLDLLTIALLRATVDTPGWEEMRKFAGSRFATATEGADDAYEEQADILLNRENVIRRLDLLLSELTRLRDLLTAEDTEALEDSFYAAAEGRARWISERKRGMWTESDISSRGDLPSAGEQIGQMLFGNLASRLKGPKDRAE